MRAVRAATFRYNLGYAVNEERRVVVARPPICQEEPP